MIRMTEFAKRRKKLLQHIGAQGIAIIPGASQLHRNADAEFPFRQHSDFYYLTGFEEPDAIAVLLPKGKLGEYLLFNRVRNRDEEIWTGYRAGQEGARKDFLADQAFPIAEFESKLSELLETRQDVYYALGVHPDVDKKMIAALNKLRGKIRGGIQAPINIIDVSQALHDMRLIKS